MALTTQNLSYLQTQSQVPIIARSGRAGASTEPYLLLSKLENQDYSSRSTDYLAVPLAIFRENTPAGEASRTDSLWDKTYECLQPLPGQKKPVDSFTPVGTLRLWPSHR